MGCINMKFKHKEHIETQADKTTCFAESTTLTRVQNCAFLVANATKTFALATRISQLVASRRLTISSHDNYTNFDFQPNRLK